MKHRNNNVKNSYLYEELNLNKNHRKSPSKSDSLKKSTFIRKKEASRKSIPNSFINVTGTRYEDDSSLIKPQKLIAQPIKLNKTKSTNYSEGRNFNTRKLNRENPYKMSFSINRK